MRGLFHYALPIRILPLPSQGHTERRGEAWRKKRRLRQRVEVRNGRAGHDEILSTEQITFRLRISAHGSIDAVCKAKCLRYSRLYATQYTHARVCVQPVFTPATNETPHTDGGNEEAQMPPRNCHNTLYCRDIFFSHSLH